MSRASSREEEKSNKRSSRAPKSDPREEGMEERTGEAAKERGYPGGTSTISLPEGVEFFNPEGETYNLDIIPYEVTDPSNLDKIPEGKFWWRRRYLIHRNIGIENQSYLCLKTIGEHCPICEHIAPLRKDWAKNKDIIKPIQAKTRDMLNVDLGDRKGIRILDISNFNFTDKLMEEIDETGDKYRRFWMTTGGHTVVVRFKMETFDKRDFPKASRIDFESRDNLSERMLNKAVNLDEVLNVLSYDELNNIFMEMVEEPGTDEGPERSEEDGASSSSSPRRSKSDDKNACPCGHTLGKDKDKHDDCTDDAKCSEDQYDSCADEKDRLEKE